MSSRVFTGAVAAALLATTVPAFTQGVQTGTVTGAVLSIDKLPLPGVTVVVTSPNLQGERMAVSDENGIYYVRGLTPGVYRVTFELSGFQTAAREGVDVTVGGIADVDATMDLAGVTETVTVTAEAPSVMARSGAAQTYTKAEIDVLPVGRRPFDVAELAPGLTTNVANVNQLTLSGSFGFDNVFMVNGVDVNDNVHGVPNDLFIEDAIEETTVLTHGISAEYGRFSGGVVNLVTRSGGNTFSGSFREGLSNPSWVKQTPLERAGNIQHTDVLSTTHEGTFGGPIVRDRVWFFSAGRYEHANTSNTLAQRGDGYTRTDTNRRGELKFTATPLTAQTVQVSYINNWRQEANRSAVPPTMLLDASTLTTRQLPNRLVGASYNGMVGARYFATVQYSQKRQGFRNNGGTSRDIVDSPFRSRGVAAGVAPSMFYNAPYLDSTDPEERNNSQVAGSVSTLLSSRRYGSHEVKGGGEYFVSTGIGGNSQSSTGYVFFADYQTAAGAPVRDAAGRAVPTFVPGVTQVWTFNATRGAEINVATTSLYAQDRWTLTPQFTLDLGTRLELVTSDATGDIRSVHTSTIVPRLGASYDVHGDGRTVVFGTYGHYAGRYGYNQFGVNTPVGRPSEVDYLYAGPAGVGRDFAPGFDLENYTRVVFANFPTANVQVAEDIRSPLTKEFTAGLGRELRFRAHARATYVWRSSTGFVEDFFEMGNGTVNVPLVGTLANRIYRNTDDLYRDYQALLFQGGYRVHDNVSVNGHYTLQLRNHGNFAGEASNQPGIPSIYGNFPEMLGESLDRLNPEGRLDNYQQHKLRVYGTYSQALGRFGSVDVSPLWRVNSGGTYSLTASLPVSPQQLALNPGYPATAISASTRNTVFFGERGEYDFAGYGVMDLAAQYNVAVWRTLRPWFKLEVYNLFNNQKTIGWDRTVSVAASSPVDANGIATTYVQGPRFGQPTLGTHFPTPYAGQTGGRAFRMAFGVRF